MVRPSGSPPCTLPLCVRVASLVLGPGGAARGAGECWCSAASARCTGEVDRPPGPVKELDKDDLDRRIESRRLRRLVPARPSTASAEILGKLGRVRGRRGFQRCRRAAGLPAPSPPGAPRVTTRAALAPTPPTAARRKAERSHLSPLVLLASDPNWTDEWATSPVTKADGGVGGRLADGRCLAVPCITQIPAAHNHLARCGLAVRYEI
jgi:hypothetical protein